MMRRLAVFVSALAVLACGRAHGQNYEIRLNRPSAVGNVYEFSAAASSLEQATVAVPGRAPRGTSSSITAKLRGTVTVLDVDALKRESRIRLMVTECLASLDGAAEKELLAKGAEVIARRRETLVDGKEAPPEIAKVLELFISFPGTQVTDDDVFGTKERRKVGDSWSMDTAVAAQDLAARGIIVAPKDLRGSTKVETLIVVEGTPCLRLTAGMEASGIVPPAMPFARVTLEKSAMTAGFSGDFPVDARLDWLAMAVKVDTEIIARGEAADGGPEVTLTMKNARSVRMETKHLK